jgi:hypothetical protein
VLAEAFEGADIQRFDPDDPACSSAVALLSAAERCDAVVAADMSRADVPGVVPSSMPWLTWITRAAAIPQAAAASPADALVVADPAWRQRALDAGWPAERVKVGGWPRVDVYPPAASAQSLAVIADTMPVVAPERLAEFSSHALLWDRISAELSAEPLALGESAATYLEQRMRRDGVGGEGFDAALFFERLVLPAYAQAIVRMLMRQGLALRLYGAGWDQVGEFAPHAMGPVSSRAELAEVGRGASAFVHVWPDPGPHPIERLGRPAVRRQAGMTPRQFVDAARRASAGRATAPPSVQPIAAAIFLALLSR